MQKNKQIITPKLVGRQRSNVNVDCIKVCPMDRQIWAMAYYQQYTSSHENKSANQNSNPSQSFEGGIQILYTHEIVGNGLCKQQQNQQSTQPQNKLSQQLQGTQKTGRFGKDSCRYVELGPVMHIQWLNTNLDTNQSREGINQNYYILAASRCDEVIICCFDTHSRQLNAQKRILLRANIFCLYCDWQLVTANFIDDRLKLQTIAAVSTNQSSVYTFHTAIQTALTSEKDNQKNIQITVGQISEYSKHEYAVWACKLNPFIYNPTKCLNIEQKSQQTNKNMMMVVGDEVDCLYLYNIQDQTLIAKNNKAHTQGICQIIWKNQSTVITGSFDGSFAEINVNNFRQVLRKWELTGTIWRFIPMQSELSSKKNNQNFQNILICNSSMKVFQLYDIDKNKNIWDSKDEHTSLAYAADSNGDFVVTASFYDQKIRIWSIRQDLI